MIEIKEKKMIDWEKRKKEITYQLDEWCEDIMYQGCDIFIEAILDQEKDIYQKAYNRGITESQIDAGN